MTYHFLKFDNAHLQIKYITCIETKHDHTLGNDHGSVITIYLRNGAMVSEKYVTTDKNADDDKRKRYYQRHKPKAEERLAEILKVINSL